MSSRLEQQSEINISPLISLLCENLEKKVTVTDKKNNIRRLIYHMLFMDKKFPMCVSITNFRIKETDQHNHENYNDDEEVTVDNIEKRKDYLIWCNVIYYNIFHIDNDYSCINIIIKHPEDNIYFLCHQMSYSHILVRGVAYLKPDGTFRIDKRTGLKQYKNYYLEHHVLTLGKSVSGIEFNQCVSCREVDNMILTIENENQKIKTELISLNNNSKCIVYCITRELIKIICSYIG